MFSWITSARAEETAEEAVEQVTTWLSLGENGWIILLAVVLGALVLGMSIMTRGKWNAKTIAFGALCMALAYVLRYVKLFEMPQGGSVTLASMFPLMLFAAAYGVGPGMLMGAAYGFMRYISSGWFVHPMQFVLDYPLAFALIGLAGLYKVMPKEWRPWSMYLCMALGALGRAFSTTLAGIFFWDTAVIPSIIYNGTYLIPDTIICILIAIPLYPRLLKLMK